MTPDLFTPAERSPLPAAEIKVAEFRQILLWPLALDFTGHGPKDTMHEIVAREADRLCKLEPKTWKRVTDPLFHLRAEAGPQPYGPTMRQEPYAEFVYFHDFVQRFLFPKAGIHAQHQSAPLQLFERSDLTSVSVDLYTGDGVETLKLAVERCNLYLFPVGVAVLAVEIATRADQPSLNLSQVLYLEDFFRRCYTPYFLGQNPGGVPAAVQWLDQSDQPIGSVSKPPNLITDLNFVVEHREPPMFAHWRALLPLRLKGSNPDPADTNFVWRHIVDERIPIMAYVQLSKHSISADHVLSAGANLARVERGDLMRLCFADTPGKKPGTYPYDKEFLNNFESEHCYQRFQNLGTLHMFSGYAYVLVAAEGEGFETFLVNHFRHMYFQMALIGHMEMAAYLAFSSRVSQEVRHASDKNDLTTSDFRQRIISIQEDFLRFVQLYRFTGISNQVQAKEMFDLWRRHLRVQALYDDVRGELESATSFAFASEGQLQTLAANDLAAAGTRLNKIAVVGLLMGLVFGFLGMNVIWDGMTVAALMGQSTALQADALASTIGRGIAILGLTLMIFAWVGISFVRNLFDDGRADEQLPLAPRPSAATERAIESFLRSTRLLGVVLFAWGLVAGWWSELTNYQRGFGVAVTTVSTLLLLLRSWSKNAKP